jgi:hypothetical protein
MTETDEASVLWGPKGDIGPGGVHLIPHAKSVMYRK